VSIANVNQVAIFYELAGKGQPCLVMHVGLGIDHTYFRPWLDPLGNVLQLVYYDHRGNGRSAAAAIRTMTHAQLAADANQLCAHLGLGQVVVLAHSDGGFIALEFALHYPKRVSHLVLMETAASMAHAKSIERHARRKGAHDRIAEVRCRNRRCNAAPTP
jgi:proline iminopeptidase